MVKIIDIPDDSEKPDRVPAWERTTFGKQYMLEVDPDRVPGEFKFDASRHRWRNW